jgi:hypothetical protein
MAICFESGDQAETFNVPSPPNKLAITCSLPPVAGMTQSLMSRLAAWSCTATSDSYARKAIYFPSGEECGNQSRVFSSSVRGILTMNGGARSSPRSTQQAYAPVCARTNNPRGRNRRGQTGEHGILSFDREICMRPPKHPTLRSKRVRSGRISQGTNGCLVGDGG